MNFGMGEIEVRLEDGSVFRGRIGNLSIECQHDQLSCNYGGAVTVFPVGPVRTTITAEIIDPQVSQESEFDRRDRMERKTLPKAEPLIKLARAITFED